MAKKDYLGSILLEGGWGILLGRNNLYFAENEFYLKQICIIDVQGKQILLRMFSFTSIIWI